MKKVILLASQSNHRKFFINYCIKIGIEIKYIIFDSKLIKPKFDVNYFYSKEEFSYETKKVLESLKNCNNSKLNILQVDDINSEFCQSMILKKLDVNNDIIVSFGTRKLSKNFIQNMGTKIINIHRGIMEKYRGLDSNLWARYHKDFENIGVTLHYVNEFLDLGDVLVQKKISLKNKPLHKWRIAETKLAADMLLFLLNNIDDISSKPLTKKGRYYSFIPSLLV